MRSRAGTGEYYRGMKTLVVVLLVACAQPRAPVKPSPEVPAIEAVLAEFWRGILKRDEQALLGIMIDGNVPFRSRNVADGSLHASTAAEFARWIATDPKAHEERFWNVSISERDGIAVLDADYEFLVEKQATNHGREVWTLIRTPQGWKITLITWSFIAGPAPKSPAPR